MKREHMFILGAFALVAVALYAKKHGGLVASPDNVADNPFVASPQFRGDNIPAGGNVVDHPFVASASYLDSQTEGPRLADGTLGGY